MLSLVKMKTFVQKIKFLIWGVENKELASDLVQKESWLNYSSDTYTDALWELEENQVLIHYEKLEGGK